MSNELKEITFLSRLRQKWFIILLGAAICYFVGYGLNKSEQLDKTQKAAYNEIQNNVVSVSGESIDPTNEGQLVYISGEVNANQTPKDGLMGVEVQALALKRNVKMFQLIEHVVEKQQRKLGPRKIGDEQGEYETVRTYQYKGEWRDELIDSDNFHDRSWNNPKEFPYENLVYSSPEAKMGAFSISADHLEACRNFQQYPLEGYDIGKLSARISNRNLFFIEKTDRFPARIYVGFGTKDSPHVGDVMISYEVLPEGEYSIIGSQMGDRIMPYMNDQLTLALMTEGKKTTEELISASQFEGNFMAWLFRGLAILFMCGGYALVFHPFNVLSSGVVSTVLKPGTFAVSLVATLITIGLIIQFA